MTKPKPKLGRPRVLTERPERKTISLMPSEWRALYRIGDSNYTAGIRRALDATKK